MNKPMVRIHNLDTDEVIDREMNAAELKEHKLDLEKYEIEKAKKDAKALSKSALLERLGITEDEAKLLLG
jgi:hypothetical protein